MICTKCKIEREFNFPIRKDTRSGYGSVCRICVSQKQLERYYRKREEIRNQQKQYYQTAKYKVWNATKEATRRFKKSQATPSWLTEEQNQKIEYLYWLCKDLEFVSGQKYHVDHIVPLKNKKVCGLHVPWNLQILPSDINISKGNRYDTTK